MYYSYNNIFFRSSNEETTTPRPPSMCAVQARNPSPDDTNIEELASYFDLFVHIPKKMSVMAEMMYIWLYLNNIISVESDGLPNSSVVFHCRFIIKCHWIQIVW